MPKANPSGEKLILMICPSSELRPQGYKTLFMLNSAENENFSANTYENANYLLAEKFSCSVMFSKKEFGIVTNLRFISMKNFMLS